MNATRITALLGLAAVAVACGRAQPAERERNLWPFSVERPADSNPAATTWTGAGPLLFRQPAATPDTRAEGFRPFWVQILQPRDNRHTTHILYPLFTYAADDATYRWSFFELVRRQGRHADAPPPASPLEHREETEIFPFWFSRQTADPADSHRALFPIHGTLRHKLGVERLSWTLFPFFVENERRGAVTTSTPWPFVRVTRGAATGWAVWPLYAHVERPGVSVKNTYLWPLGYDNTLQPPPDAAPGTPPRREIGALPFYARVSAPGYLNEDFLWPFFGHTAQTQPRRYDERRYLWPFFVQGAGDDLHVNRWAPFYSHSINRGYDKRWIAWPLLRHATWTEAGLERQRVQLLYFLFWHEEQRAPARPAAPVASLTHIWPLFSHWDNGAGRLQWQALSPLDVFFPRNDKVRLAWSPLFALARHERSADGHQRTSLLWNALTWERQPSTAHLEFHLGPILGFSRDAQATRIAVGRGLFGLRRSATGGWRFFWLDFSDEAVTSSNPTRRP